MIDKDTFVNRYFAWLLDQCFATKQRQENYIGVLRILYDIPFYWVAEFSMDENRAGDAQVYRKYERYMLDQEQHNIDPYWLDQWEQAAPSVLEVMVGIAERWSQFFDKPTPYYFNHLFRNMGFHQFRGSYLRPMEEEAIRWSVDKWLTRQIAPNGDGSPFPIQKSRGDADMRALDIWHQMNAYSRQHFQ